MSQNVVSRVDLLAESPLADVTSEWPDSVVDDLVGFEVLRRGEGLVTHRAFVGFVLKAKEASVTREAVFESKKVLKMCGALVRLSHSYIINYDFCISLVLMAKVRFITRCSFFFFAEFHCKSRNLQN